MPASAEAWRKASPDPSESSTKPYLLTALYHFTLPQTVGAGGSPSCGSASCGGPWSALRSRCRPLHIAGPPSASKDRRCPPHVAGPRNAPQGHRCLPLFDDLLSTLTNQPASLYDEFGYGFEHARLRTRNSRYSVPEVNHDRAGRLALPATSCPSITVFRAGRSQNS
jgi:hypothetical protein